jgi:hypothetical protein
MRIGGRLDRKTLRHTCWSWAINRAYFVLGNSKNETAWQAAAHVSLESAVGLFFVCVLSTRLVSL